MKKLDFKRRVFAIVCIVVCLCVSVVPSFAYIDEENPVKTDYSSFSDRVVFPITNQDIRKLPEIVNTLDALGLFGNWYPLAITFYNRGLAVFCAPASIYDFQDLSPLQLGGQVETTELGSLKISFVTDTSEVIKATPFGVTTKGLIEPTIISAQESLVFGNPAEGYFIAYYRAVGSADWIEVNQRPNNDTSSETFTTLLENVTNYATPINTETYFDEGFSAGYEQGYAEALASIPNNTNGLGGVTNDFVNLLTGGISGLASGIGSGANGFVRDLFLAVGENGSITGLSTFGGVVAVFGGIALAVGLTTLIFNWIRNRGG